VTVEFSGDIGQVDASSSFAAGQNRGFERVPVSPAVVVADTTPPVVSNFVPAVGTPVTAQQPVQFDVTDDSGQFRRINVHAVYGDGVEEVVHNGDSFRGYYSTSSSRVIIAGGFRYTVLRAGGWPSTPRITIFAIDVAGNEAA
jgi:hypothetical protein